MDPSFQRAVLVIRDPYGSILSELTAEDVNHTCTAPGSVLDTGGKYRGVCDSGHNQSYVTSILCHGQWSRLVNGCTTCTQTVADSTCIYRKKYCIIFISHIIAPRHNMTDSEIMSNRCNHV